MGDRAQAATEATPLLFAIVGLLIVALGVPLWRRWVAPNRLYGVRTARTLADESQWYESNARAGRAMVVAGAAAAALSVAFDRLGVSGDAHALAMAGVIVAGAAIVTFAGLGGTGRGG